MSLEKFEKVRSILDGHPKMPLDLPKRYVRTLNYIVLAEIELHRFDDAREHIERASAP